MTAGNLQAAQGIQQVTYQDFLRTGPGTLAGRYLRMFWQPVYHSQDLPAGRAVPLPIMGEDFALYRGDTGTAQIVASRCAHRGTQLSTGWVEGDCLRCFYHGWKYDRSGQCVEQPAEPEPFAHNVRIRSYPTREYLGLIFAYLGEGEPPEFPRYPEFEDVEGIVEIGEHSYVRRCTYFANIDNIFDVSHLAFVHSQRHPGYFTSDNRGFWSADKQVRCEETDWGVVFYAASGNPYTVNLFGMPNVAHLYMGGNDPGIGYVDHLLWFVPIDDEQHRQFDVTRVFVTGEAACEYQEAHRARLAKWELDHAALADAVLKGKLRLEDVDRERTTFVTLQDDVAQVGQGRIEDRGPGQERLGRSDFGVIALRKVWARELRALAEGRPIKRWTAATWTAVPDRGESVSQ